MSTHSYSVDGEELNRLLRLLLAYADQQKMDHAKLAFMINIISVKMGEELGIEVESVEEAEEMH